MSPFSDIPFYTRLKMITVVGLLLTAVPHGIVEAQRASTIEQCRQQVIMFRQANASRFQSARGQSNMDEIQAIRNELRGIAAGCLKTLDAKTVLASQTGDLAVLQTEAGQFDDGYATLKHYVTDTSTSEFDRATSIESVQRAVAEGGADATTLGQMQQLVALADSAGTARARINTRILLAQLSRATTASKGNSYTLAREAIDVASHDPDTTTRSKRAKAMGSLVNTIGQWATRDKRTEELTAARAAADSAFTPYLAYRLSIDPNALVGSPAPAIEAAQWLHAPKGTTRQDFGDGNVYLIELTAHWCGPCRMTYHPLQVLHRQYSNDGFRILFATQFFGYYGTAGGLTPRAELDSLQVYFKEHEVTFPVAVAGDITLPAGRPQLNPNFDNYGMRALPEFVLVGADGVIRKVWRGWSDDRIGELDAEIRDALAAKSLAGSKPAQR